MLGYNRVLGMLHPFSTWSVLDMLTQEWNAHIYQKH